MTIEELVDRFGLSAFFPDAMSETAFGLLIAVGFLFLATMLLAIWLIGIASRARRTLKDVRMEREELQRVKADLVAMQDREGVDTALKVRRRVRIGAADRTPEADVELVLNPSSRVQ